MALTPRPAHSDSAGDVLAQLQSLRQQLAQLLAAYRSSEPEARAIMDRSLATGYVPALQKIYNSLPPSDRDAVDDQIRQETGYTFLQLIQMSSTVPGLVRSLNLLADAVSGLAAGTKVSQTRSPATTTTKPEQTTKSKTATAPAKPEEPGKSSTTSPPSGIIGFEPPSQGGAVDLSSSKDLKLKLGWVLYGRTDLTDEEAQAIYDAKVKKQVRSLDATLGAATKRLETAERRLKLFEEAGEKTGVQRIINALKDDLKEARNERAEAVKNLGSFFLKEAAGRVSESLENVLDLTAVGTGAHDMQALVLKSKRTQEDWEKAGNGLVGVLTAASKQAGLKVVGPVAGVAELAADAIYLHLADSRVRVLEDSLAQANVQTEQYRNRLLQQIQMERDRIEAIQREKTLLTSKEYLKFYSIP
ncbi:MAG: hypothetical protein QME70_03410 [Bacillota bacterium]|nr:hypothetical protein [Bacillota bacterium]